MSQDVAIQALLLTPAELHARLLGAPLFEQLRERPECLEIIPIGDGHFRLHLIAFPGLRTAELNNRAFGELHVSGLALTGGHVTSGGPDGVYVQYGYSVVEPEPGADAAPSGP